MAHSMCFSSEEDIYPKLDPEDYFRWMYESQGTTQCKRLLGLALDRWFTKREVVDELTGGDPSLLYDGPFDMLSHMDFNEIKDYLTREMDHKELFLLAFNYIPDNELEEFMAEYWEDETDQIEDVSSKIHHGDIDLKQLCEGIGWDEILKLAVREGKLRKRDIPIEHIRPIPGVRMIEFDKEEVRVRT